MQRRGVFLEIVERVGEAFFAHVAVDVGVERELARAQARLRVELRDVEAVLAERVERTRERAGLVGHGEDERRLAVGARGSRFELGGDAGRNRSAEEQEARRVVGMIGDRTGQFDEAVALGGFFGADRRVRRILGRGHVAGRDRGIADRDAFHVGQRGEKTAALGQHDRVRLDLAHALERGAGQTDEAMLEPQRDLRQRVELVFGQDVVAFADRTGDRVVDRQQADVGPAAEHGMGDRAERRAAQRFERHAAPARVGLEHHV